MEFGGVRACVWGETERERQRSGVMHTVQRQFVSISPGRRAEEPGDGVPSHGAAAHLCTGAAKLASTLPVAGIGWHRESLWSSSPCERNRTALEKPI